MKPALYKLYICVRTVIKYTKVEIPIILIVDLHFE